MRAAAVEAAKFVGTHVRCVAPTAAACAHRHCAPALCLKVAQLVARGASPDRWHIGMHHELLVVQFILLGNCFEKKVILIAWDRVPSRLVRRRTSFTVEWYTRN